MPYFGVPIEIPPKRISYDWSDVYFLAESENEPFEDAKIITTKTEYRNRIYDQALEVVLEKYPDWGYRDNKRAENYLTKIERELLENCDGSVKESVSMLEDGTIQIVVDVDSIDDDSVVEKALHLFSQYRAYGECEEFGKEIAFTPDQFNTNEFEGDV